MLQLPGGILWKYDPQELASQLSADMAELPTAQQPIDARVVNIDFQGDGKSSRITFFLESSVLAEENRWLRNYLGERNGVSLRWEAYQPLMGVAMILNRFADEAVLDAVWNIAQPQFTLQPPVPLVGNGDTLAC